MTAIPAPHAFIGCDVGKHQIVVFDSLTGQTTVLVNAPVPLAAFAATLSNDCLVVCEATGRYEAALLDALTRAGRSAIRADARKVKAFIRSYGTLDQPSFNQNRLNEVKLIYFQRVRATVRVQLDARCSRQDRCHRRRSAGPLRPGAPYGAGPLAARRCRPRPAACPHRHPAQPHRRPHRLDQPRQSPRR
jgi:transposase